MGVRERTYALFGEIFAVAVIAVFPLYITGDKYIGLTGHKAQAFWIFTLLFAVSLAVLKIALAGLPKEKKIEKTVWRRNLRVPDIAALVYLALIFGSVISNPLGIDGSTLFFGSTSPLAERFDGLYTQICYIAAYFILSRLYRYKARDAVIFAVSAIIVSLIGFLQFAGADFLNLFPYAAYGFDYPYGEHDIWFRTTLGNVDIVAAYVSLTCPLFAALYAVTEGKSRFFSLAAAALTFQLTFVADAESGKVGILAGFVLLAALFLTEREKLSRVLLCVGAGLLTLVPVDASLRAAEHFHSSDGISPAYAFNFTGAFTSRKFLLGLGCIAVSAVLSFAPFPKFKREITPKIKALAAGIFAFVIVLGGLIGVEILGAKAPDGNILYEARQVMHGDLQDDFGSNRGFVWKRSVEIIPRHALLGAGPDSFAAAFKDFQEEAIAKYNTPFDKAHNELLQIAVTTGIPAAIAFAVWIIAVIAGGVKRTYSDGFAAAFAVSAFAMFVQSMFGVGVPISMPLFFAVAGICAGFSRVQVRKTGA